MLPSTRLFLGKGARWSCLVKFIRLSKDIATALVNLEPGRHIDDLIAISRARMCILFCIPVPAGRHFSESAEFRSISGPDSFGTHVGIKSFQGKPGFRTQEFRPDFRIHTYL